MEVTPDTDVSLFTCLCGEPACRGVYVHKTRARATQSAASLPGSSGAEEPSSREKYLLQKFLSFMLAMTEPGFCSWRKLQQSPKLTRAHLAAFGKAFVKTSTLANYLGRNEKALKSLLRAQRKKLKVTSLGFDIVEY